LGICCSPNPHGNTEVLLNEALKGAAGEGAQPELFSAAGKNLQPCDGCASCMKTGRCKIEDDMQPLYEKMLSADGLIFGAPIYFYNMAAQAKIVMDRTFCLDAPGHNLANKVGAVVVTAGSFGMADAVKDLYFFMITKQMLPANFVAAYPERGSGFKNFEKTLKAANDMGRQMVKIAAQNFRYPADIPHAGFAYGTHTVSR
jgi:multimeric flavodoxin WrbA